MLLKKELHINKDMQVIRMNMVPITYLGSIQNEFINSIPEFERELKLKDLEQSEMNWNFVYELELELNEKELSI